MQSPLGLVKYRVRARALGLQVAKLTLMVHTLEGSWERRRWQFGDPAPEHQGPAAGREEFLPTWEHVQDRQPRTQNLPGPKFRLEPGLT